MVKNAFVVRTALCSAATLLLITCLITSAASATERFFAPKFASGTIFVFEVSALHRPNEKFVLKYHGKTGSSYDFGRYELSSSLLITRQGYIRREIFSPIKFPLSFRNTWKYRNNFRSRNRECDITRTMTALVGNSMERVTVAGQEFDVVRVTHKGWQTRKCGTNLPVGEDVTREYLYSPKLGMYVEMHFEIRYETGELLADTTIRMKSFTVPARTSP